MSVHSNSLLANYRQVKKFVFWAFNHIQTVQYGFLLLKKYIFNFQTREIRTRAAAKKNASIGRSVSTSESEIPDKALTRSRSLDDIDKKNKLGSVSLELNVSQPKLYRMIGKVGRTDEQIKLVT